MAEKIYFGDVDIIDTRTGNIATVGKVIFKASQTTNELRGRVLQAIPAHDRKHYHIERFHTAGAKVIGETA